MLNARSDSPYEAQDPSSVLGDGANLWDDASPASRRSSRRYAEPGSSSAHNSQGMADDSALSTTLGRAGLRSRKASLHRRASSLASAAHPLQSPSSPKGRTSSNAEGKRPSYRRRQASENDLKDTSGTLLDDEFERQTVREPEISAIVHEVRLSIGVQNTAHALET